MINGCTDRLWKWWLRIGPAIVKGCGNAVELVDHEFVAELVEVVGGYAGLDVVTDHVQNAGRGLACRAHTLQICFRFEHSSHQNNRFEGQRVMV